MKAKTDFILAGVFCILFLLLIVLLCTVDVIIVDSPQTSHFSIWIGLAGLNTSVSAQLPLRMGLYKATNYLGYLALLAGAAFALVGLVQLVARRSLRKVDPAILALGGLYVLIGVIYVFFEKVIVNYRPFLMPGATYPEASFPSSHTVLACVVLGSVILMLGRYVKRRGLCRALQILCAVLMAAIVVGRLLSGVHWITDILGGLLLTASLLFLFIGVLKRIDRAE